MTGVDVPLGLMMNLVMSHLNSLVRVEAGDQLPPFYLLTQDLPQMLLPLPTERLQEIQEGILQHNLECRDVQAHLNSKRQRLHRVAAKYGLSTNLWTAIVLMIPVLLLEAGQVGGFLVYDCSHDQLKTQTIDLTAPKDYKEPATD
jgi:hypothetical protein